jgi:hypothetical protein
MESLPSFLARLEIVVWSGARQSKSSTENSERRNPSVGRKPRWKTVPTVAAAGRVEARMPPAAARAWRPAGVAQAAAREPAGRHREAPQPAVLAAHHRAHPHRAAPAAALPLLLNPPPPARTTLPAAAVSWFRPRATVLWFRAFCWVPWACWWPGNGSAGNTIRTDRGRARRRLARWLVTRGDERYRSQSQCFPRAGGVRSAPDAGGGPCVHTEHAGFVPPRWTICAGPAAYIVGLTPPSERPSEPVPSPGVDVPPVELPPAPPLLELAPVDTATSWTQL